MEVVFRFKSWFLNAPGLIHGGAYYRSFRGIYCHVLPSLNKVALPSFLLPVSDVSYGVQKLIAWNISVRT